MGGRCRLGSVINAILRYARAVSTSVPNAEYTCALIVRLLVVNASGVYVRNASVHAND